MSSDLAAAVLPLRPHAASGGLLLAPHGIPALLATLETQGTAQ